MKKIQVLKLAFCHLALITISAARGQVAPSGPTDGLGPIDGRLLLYRLDGTQGKYLLSMSLESGKNVKTSFVVIGDTFSVRPSGAVCSVLMSNVYILETQFSRAQSNEVVQLKLRTDFYEWFFPKD